jgi:hypothetical protein
LTLAKTYFEDALKSFKSDMEKKKNPKTVSLEFIEAKEDEKVKLKGIVVKIEGKGLEFSIKFIKY